MTHGQSSMSIKNRTNEMINIVTQISKSFVSNLDLENLINSVVTLIYHNLYFYRVNIYLLQSEQSYILKKVSISDSGFSVTNEHYSGNNENPISWAFLQHKSVIVNDTSQENRFTLYDYDINCNSEYVIPLIFGETFIGVLDLCSDITKYFSSDNIKILNTLSENISVALRNAKLYHYEHLKREIFESLQKTIGNISADITEYEVCIKALAALGKYLHIDVCAIWLIDDITSENDIRIFTPSVKLMSVNVNEELLSTDKQFNYYRLDDIYDGLITYDNNGALFSEFPWMREISAAKNPIIIHPEIATDPLGLMFSYTREYSALGIPLSNKKNNLGMIIAVSHLPDQFDDDSVLIASTISDYVSVAIENAKLFHLTHEQVWMNTVLQQFNEATRPITSMAELVETITSMLINLIGVSGCTLFITDQSIGAFFPLGSSGFDEERRARLNSFNIYSGTVNAFDILYHSKDSVIINSDTISDDIAALIFPSYELKSNLMILFPMTNQDDLIGAVLIDFTNSNLLKKSSQRIWDEMFVLIKGILNQAAASIVILQAIKSLEEEAYISIALSQVAQAIVSLNQLDEILRSVVRITPILVGVKKCILYLWDCAEYLFIPVQNFGFSKNDNRFENEIFQPDDFPLLKIVFEENLIAYFQVEQSIPSLHWNDIKSDSIQVIQGKGRGIDDIYEIKIDKEVLQVRSRLLIGFPLSIKGEVLGVMLIEEEEPGKGSLSYHIREKRIEIVTGISQQAALAIKNDYLQREALKSERMEQELQLARDIQKTFLPDTLPIIPGWDIDIRWKPARQVAGDFYDYFYIERNVLGFVIADVADKGMPAALFMTLIRTLIRAAAKDHPSPAAVIKQVNDLLFPDAKNGMFVTVFYAVIYLESGLITYVNAGHNPPVICALNSGYLTELTRTSVALGIFDDIEVQEVAVSLKQGDWIFFYTDGITEAFSDNEEMFGVNRLHRLLLEKYYTSAKEIVDDVENSVHEFIEGTDLSDDITLAAIYNKNILMN